MSDPSTLDAIAELAECPDGATITEAIVVVGYLDAEGESCLGFSTVGEGLRTSYLGLLSWAQIQLAGLTPE